MAAVLLARERPRPLFWAVCGLGLLAVLGFGLMLGAGQLGCGDLHLLLVALGYAEGGRLARELDGWRVVSWALVVGLPVAITVTSLTPRRRRCRRRPPGWRSGTSACSTCCWAFSRGPEAWR